jgi:hypothetical protein
MLCFFIFTFVHHRIRFVLVRMHATPLRSLEGSEISMWSRRVDPLIFEVILISSRTLLGGFSSVRTREWRPNRFRMSLQQIDLLTRSFKFA